MLNIYNYIYLPREVTKIHSVLGRIKTQTDIVGISMSVYEGVDPLISGPGIQANQLDSVQIGEECIFLGFYNNNKSP